MHTCIMYVMYAYQVRQSQGKAEVLYRRALEVDRRCLGRLRVKSGNKTSDNLFVTIHINEIIIFIAWHVVYIAV